jgi:hypothetical protein
LKIYLACPYSHPNKAIEAKRFQAANKAAADLMSKGYLVFSPISHTHPIHLAGNLPGDYEFWRKYDQTFINWCDAVWVLKISGWSESKGIKQEVEYAEFIGKPVRYI